MYLLSLICLMTSEDIKHKILSLYLSFCLCTRLLWHMFLLSTVDTIEISLIAFSSSINSSSRSSSTTSSSLVSFSESKILPEKSLDLPGKHKKRNVETRWGLEPSMSKIREVVAR